MSHGLDIPLPHWNKINISILTHAWTTLVRRGIYQMVTPVKFLKFEFYPRKVCMWISIVSATNWAWRMFCTCIWHQSWVFLLQYTHIQTSSSCFTQIEQFFAPILVNFYPSPKEFYTIAARDKIHVWPWCYIGCRFLWNASRCCWLGQVTLLVFQNLNIDARKILRWWVCLLMWEQPW